MNSSKVTVFLRGFTLIELTMCLAIIFVLTVVLLGRYPETAVRLSLANMNHTLALLVREAQVRGSAVDYVNSTVGGYGIHVALSAPDRVILFGDSVDSTAPKPYGITVGNGLYESGSPIDETRTITTLKTRYVISKLCTGTGFPYVCNTAASPDISSLTISFTRPNPTPSVYVNNATSSSATAACIELRSPQAPLSGHVRNVQVFGSGMIRTDIGKCDNSPL